MFPKLQELYFLILEFDFRKLCASLRVRAAIDSRDKSGHLRSGFVAFFKHHRSGGKQHVKPTSDGKNPLNRDLTSIRSL